jgi:hypothetical protein
MSADPTRANSSYCGPEPFSRKSWQFNSTLNVLDPSLGGGVAPAIITQRSANGFVNPPGTACFECCCCAIAAPGTFNFCALSSDGGWQTTIPNCNYMSLHPDIVLSSMVALGSFQEGYTIPGIFLTWEIMDPAYG